MNASRSSIVVYPQPDVESCGPTCLNALYGYLGISAALAETIASVGKLDTGGTIAPYLGIDALCRGLRATIVPFETRVFDPSWQGWTRAELADSLAASIPFREGAKTKLVTQAYSDFLKQGGAVEFFELSVPRVTDFLRRYGAFIAGVDTTYLHQAKREVALPNDFDYDDIRGQPLGHFVVVYGYDAHADEFLVADPQLPNPSSEHNQHLRFSSSRLFSAVLLGVTSFDSALLALEKN